MVVRQLVRPRPSASWPANPSPTTNLRWSAAAIIVHTSMRPCVCVMLLSSLACVYSSWSQAAAVQSTVAGLGMVIGSIVAFSWKSSDAMDVEKLRAVRHQMSGKVRSLSADSGPLTTLTPKPTSEVFHSLCIGLARTQNRLGCPLPQYSDGDDELVKHIQRRASSITPESPEQILQMRNIRHEFSGKLVMRPTENC